MRLFKRKLRYRRIYNISIDCYLVFGWIGNKDHCYIEDIREVLPKEDQDKARELMLSRMESFLRNGVPKAKEGIWSQENTSFLKYCGGGITDRFPGLLPLAVLDADKVNSSV
jgi:hypothetical protein